MVRSRIYCLALLASIAAVEQAAAATLLVEFTSPTCGPCRGMRPILRRLARDGYTIREVDVSRHPEIATQYRVDRWPTFLVLVDGREHARLVGATSKAQLVEMITKATALAAASASGPNGPPQPMVQPVDFASDGGAGAPQTFVDEPKQGRLVDVKTPAAVSRRRAAPMPSAPASLNDSSQSVVNPVEPPAGANLIAATVRLSVEDPDGRSNGTGTIIDSRQGEALVLTCGHMFRTSAGKGTIEISLFRDGPSGAEPVGKAEGMLVDFDLDRDLALVRFRTSSPLAVSRVAPAGAAPTLGAAVASVGCDGGANPTVWPTRVTAVDRYQGHPNIEAARAPVEGRSGGGLFDAAGRLIGVCYASDHESNEGLYASLPSIHAKLDALNLQFVYEQPEGGPMIAATTPAAADSPGARTLPDHIAIRGQSPTPVVPTPVTVSPPDGWGDAAAAPRVATPSPMAEAPDSGESIAEAPLTPADQATLEELDRRREGAEVICIIRPLTPGARSDVIKLNNASPSLVRAISAAGERAPLEAASAAAGANSPAIR